MPRPECLLNPHPSFRRTCSVVANTLPVKDERTGALPINLEILHFRSASNSELHGRFPLPCDTSF